MFIGCANLSWHCLDELLKNKANVVATFTLDEQSAKQASDFKSPQDLAQEYKFPLHTIKRGETNTKENSTKIASYKPDIIFCIGWPDLIKKEILSLTPYALGMHPSKLPKDRGQAPIPWSLMRNYKKGALSMFFLKEVEDAGDIVAQKEYAIKEEDTSTTIYQKIIDAGRTIIKETVPKIENNMLKGIPQKENEATYTRKRTPNDSYIEWNASTKEIYNLIRAITGPYYPGAFSFFNGEKIKLWSSQIFKPENKYFGVPGQIVHKTKDGIIVRTKDGCLLIDKVSLGEQSSFQQAMHPTAIESLKKNIRLGINFLEEIGKLKRRVKELEDAKR